MGCVLPRSRGRHVPSPFQVYVVPMPYEVARLLSVFDLLNISIDGVGVPLQCLRLGTYEQQLGTTMLLPVVIAAAIVLGFMARGCCRRSAGLATELFAALPWLLLLSFLVFPLVSSASFRAFSCEPFDDGRSFLRAEWAAAPSRTTRPPLLHPPPLFYAAALAPAPLRAA